MKTLYIYLAAFALLLVPVLAQASVQVGDYNAGMVGYWSLNEGVGSAAYDTSGSNNFASLTGSPSWVAGKFNNALQFSGSPQVASTSLAWPSTGGTMVLWVNPSSYSNWISPAGWKLLGSTNGYLLIDEGGSGTPGKWRFVTRLDNSGAAEAGVVASANIVQNTWQQLVATWSVSGSTYTIHLYVNGVDQGSATWVGTPGVGGVGHFHFGNSGDFPDNYFLGNVDDVRVFNYPMTANQVKSLYQTGAPAVTIGKTNPTTLSTGLVGYWTLDGKNTNWSTGTVADSSGQGSNGSLINMSTTTSPVAGKIGQALLFNGANTEIRVTDPGSFDPSAITVSAWIYSTGSNPSVGAERIVDKANSGTITQNGFRMAAYTAANCGSSNAQWGFQWYNGSAQLVCGPLIASTTNSWTHIVFTHDGTTGRIYANGVLLGSLTTPFTGSSAFNVVIGNSDQVNKPFTGKIDDVRVYNRALSAQEVAQLYKNGGGTIGQSNTTANASGLVGQWTFDGKTVNWATGTAADSSGQGNTGSLINMSTTTSPVAGKMGQALNFSGSYVDAGNNPSLRVTSDMTISAWVNASTIPSGAGLGPAIAGKFSTTGNARSYQLYIVESTNKPTFIFSSDGTSGTNAVISSNSAITTNAWYHLVATHSSAGVVRIYINGVLDKALSGVSGTIFDSGTGANFNIGRQGDGNRAFSGNIDDVRVYNRVLSATEVAHLYAAGK